jgi:branched-chain amino acid transport system ATP-binding protein
LLEITQLSSYYGPIQALRAVSLDLQEGEAIAVLGANGAGKSTLLRTISGLVKPRAGSISYRGHAIAGRGPDEIVRLGIVQVPEGRRIFTQMTVLENLLMGAYTRSNGKSMSDHLEFVFSSFPDLRDKRSQLGGELSGGQQQMLAIGRALMSEPTLLLLDEPSLGLSPIMVEQLGATVTSIRRDLGMSIMLVEQNAGLALELTSRVYVMQTGAVVLSGSTEDVSLEKIHEAYLGGVAAGGV